MSKNYFVASVIVFVLVLFGVNMSEIVDASFANATNTPSPARARTGRAPATATNTPRPTRDRTAKPRRTKTPQATSAPNATPEPTADTPNPSQPDASDALTSQLLILNPDHSGVARVTVNIFDLSGALAFSDTFKIQENGAKIVSVPKTLGSDFLGSARVTANRRVQALVLDDNQNGTASDVYQVTGVKTSALTLPYLQHGSAGSQADSAATTPHSMVAIQNISAVETEATFIAYDTNGAEIISRALTLAARASAYLDTQDLFGDTPFLGSARITANQPIAAAELVSWRDTASVRALTTRDEDNRLVVSNLERRTRKDGKLKAWSTLLIRNNGNAATDLVVSYYNAQGKLKGKIVRANVPADALVVLDTRADEFQFLGKNFSGWASVSATDKTPLVVHSLATRGRGKHVSAIGGVGRTRINGRNVCGEVRVTASQKSVLTLLNPRKHAARARIRLYAHAGGAPVAVLERELAPRAQIQITAQDGLPQNFEGIAIVGADQELSRPLVATVLTQTLHGKRASSTSGYLCR